jgi:hypothetical protein
MEMSKRMKRFIFLGALVALLPAPRATLAAIVAAQRVHFRAMQR